MRVAVLTLTRDRLAYTQHCFATLRENAGCEYDHYVLDQGSTDGTAEWLEEYPARLKAILPENIGISRGLNKLLNSLLFDYDVVVKYDNDCELLTPNTVLDIAALTLRTNWLLSPVVLGCGTPLVSRREHRLEQYVLAEKAQIRGLFLAATGLFYERFRYSEANPVWGQDDAQVCTGRRCAEVLGYEANHYETTAGQEARYPEYFARKVAEGMPWP